MVDPAFPKLKHQIEQAELTLQRLRRDLAERQARADELAARKQELLAELSRVDADISSLTGEGPSTPAVTPVTTGPDGPKRRGRKPGAGGKGKAGPPEEGGGPEGPGKVPLRDALTQVLKRARKPLGTSELAEKVLAAGYQTRSKDFANVVQVTLAKVEGLERVPGEGYRLKKD